MTVATSSINIEAMRSLLSTMRTAGVEFDGRRSDLAGVLSGQGLPTEAPDPIVQVTAWCDDQIPPLLRRLSLAEELAASTPGAQLTVTIDESRISTLTPGEAQQEAASIAETMNEGDALSDEQLAILVENAGDPYFAVALANAVPPERMAELAVTLSSGYEDRPQYDHNNSEGESFEEWHARITQEYESRLAALGITMGTASRSDDPPLRDGYAEDVAAVMTAEESYGMLPAAMSVVLGYGSFEAGFADTVATAVYDYENEGEDFPTWLALASSTHMTLPGEEHRTDVMAGIMAMLGNSPEGAQLFFTGGPTETIEIDGQQVEVSSRLQYLIQELTWSIGRGSDDGAGLGRALEGATTSFRNTEASGQTSAELATQAFALIAAETREGRQMRDGMRADVAAMLADYAPDLFRTVGDPPVEDDLTGQLYAAQDDLFPVGMPYGALLTDEVVTNLMFTLGQEPEHVATVGAGWAAANHVYLNHQLQEALANDDEAAVAYLLGQLNGPDNHAANGASVLDFLMDTAYGGDDADAEAQAQRAKAMQDILGLVTSIPVLKPAELLGEWGGWAFDQAKTRTLRVVGESGAGEADTDELNAYRDQAATEAQQMYLDALLANGYFDPEVIEQVNQTPGVTLEAPSLGALTIDENGETVFDVDSQEFQKWALDNAPISAIQQAIIAAFELEPR